MAEGEGNINLLPEELQKIEEQLTKPHLKEMPISFHLPEEIKPPKIPPPPAAPVSQPVSLPASPLGSAPSALSSGPRLGLEESSGPKGRGEPASRGEPPKPLLPPQKPNLVEPFAARMDVNLIPEGTYLLSNRRLGISLGKTAAAALGLAILAYLGTFAYGQYLKKQTGDLDVQLSRAETALASYQKMETEAENTTAKLQAAQTLLNRHLYWTKFFSHLESLTIEEVYYSSLAAAQNGLITLAASAPNYTAVARQYLVFQQADKVVESVNITGASGDPQSANITFNILLKIKPEVYQASPD